jgi:Kelch motif
MTASAATTQATTGDPLFAGLFDRSITANPETVAKQRYMTSVAPMAANPGRWVEQPRLPIPVGEHGVIECGGKIHVIAGYACHRVDGAFHQVYDPGSKSWSQKAPFPLPCNHVAAVSIGTKIYTFGGFIEQNRCPHSKCFAYDSATDSWQAIAGLARPRGAISAIVLDGNVHLLGGATCVPSNGTKSTIRRPINIRSLAECAA